MHRKNGVHGMHPTGLVKGDFTSVPQLNSRPALESQDSNPVSFPAFDVTFSFFPEVFHYSLMKDRSGPR